MLRLLTSSQIKKGLSSQGSSHVARLVGIYLVFSVLAAVHVQPVLLLDIDLSPVHLCIGRMF